MSLRMVNGKLVSPKPKLKGKHGGTRSGAHPKKRLPASKVMQVGSIRMTPEQWKLFETWGGAPRLRAHMDKVKGGVNKNA